MKNVFTTRASDYLKTRFGSILILSTVIICAVSNWLFFNGTLGTSYSDYSLFVGVASFFISCILIILRFEEVSERIFNIVSLVFNLLSWWWLIHEINNPSVGGAAVMLVFICVQFYTLKRSYNLLRWLAFKTAKEK